MSCMGLHVYMCSMPVFVTYVYAHVPVHASLYVYVCVFAHKNIHTHSLIKYHYACVSACVCYTMFYLFMRVRTVSVWLLPALRCLVLKALLTTNNVLLTTGEGGITRKKTPAIKHGTGKSPFDIYIYIYIYICVCV